jgi:WD40 repeat protein
MAYRPIRDTLRRHAWLSLAAIVLLLALALSACGDGDAPEPAATPTPEPAAEFSPELLFSYQHEDDQGNVVVGSVAFSPDGDMVAAGVFLGALLFDVPDGAVVRDIEYRHSVDDLAFSPDGAILGAGQGLGGVQLSAVADGSELHQLERGFDSRVAFSPDGAFVATGDRSGVVWIWRVEDGERVAEFTPPADEWLMVITYSPDGEMIASGHWDGTVYLWNAADGRLLRTLENPDDFGYATSLSFSPDGELLAVAGAMEEFTDVVRIWDIADGSVHAVLAFESQTRTVGFSPDGTFLAAGCGEGVSLWHVSDMTLAYALDFVVDPGESDWVTDLAFSPDSTMLIAGRWNGTLELWRVQT